MNGKELLAKYLEEGTVFVDDGVYVGEASDGQDVVIGNTPTDVAKYLEANPTPDKW